MKRALIFSLLAIASLCSTGHVGGQILAPIFFAPGHHGPAPPPTQDMILWVSADCMTTISPCTSPANGTTNPAVWKDRSPQHNDMAVSGSGTATFQTNQINGQSAMLFSAATPEVYLIGSSLPLENVSGRIVNVYMVYKRADATTTFDFFECNGGGTPVNCVEYRSTSAQLQVLCDPRVVCYANGAAGGNSTWNQINFTLTYGATSTASFRRNEATDGSTTTGIAGLPTNANQTYGIPNEGDFRLSGQIAEMIFYSGTNAVGTRTATIEAYFNSKYGI